jgi:DnaK suppressor protein
MDDNILPQYVEGQSNTHFRATDGGIWNSLQGLKEEVSQEILAEGPLHQCASGHACKNEASAQARKVESIHRAQLETRLREINYAQDRLLDSIYGKCVDCGNQMTAGRLAADPAVSRCLECERATGSNVLHSEEQWRPDLADAGDRCHQHVYPIRLANSACVSR